VPTTQRWSAVSARPCKSRASCGRPLGAQRFATAGGATARPGSGDADYIINNLGLKFKNVFVFLDWLSSLDCDIFLNNEIQLVFDSKKAV
jgi:hypothetical protein